MNSINLVGNLGKDAEMKDVGDHKLLSFAVACSTGFGDKKVSSWYNCQLWGNRGEKLQDYLKKGTKVYVNGELTLREYDKKDGSKGMSADINVNNVELLGGNNSEKSDESVPF